MTQTVTGNVRVFRFGPGRKESLTLAVYKRRGILHARVTGNAYVACGMGNEHYPDVDERVSHLPTATGTEPALLVRAYAGDEDAADELADELETWALEGWFDPCDTESEDE